MCVCMEIYLYVLVGGTHDFVNPLIMSFYGLSKTLDRRRSRAEVR